MYYDGVPSCGHRAARDQTVYNKWLVVQQETSMCRVRGCPSGSSCVINEAEQHSSTAAFLISKSRHARAEHALVPM